MIRTTVEIDAASLKKMIRIMKEADPESVARMRADFRTRIGPVARVVANQVPSESPFVGMQRNISGRVQWGKPSARVSVAPSKKTNRLGFSSIVTVVLENKKKLGFSYVENAGTRRRPKKPMAREYTRAGDSKVTRRANTTQGDALILKAKRESSFNFKAGHFAYGHFLRLRPAMLKMAQKSMDKLGKKFSVKLGRR